MADLPVRGIYLYFEALSRANALEQFLSECDRKQLTLGVSEALYRVGESHFNELKKGAGAGLESVGPECPACPRPPGL